MRRVFSSRDIQDGRLKKAKEKLAHEDHGTSGLFIEYNNLSTDYDIGFLMPLSPKTSLRGYSILFGYAH